MRIPPFLLVLVCLTGLAGCSLLSGAGPVKDDVRRALEKRLDVEARHVFEMKQLGRCAPAGQGDSNTEFTCPLQVVFYDEGALEARVGSAVSEEVSMNMLKGDFTIRRANDGRSWEMSDRFHAEREAAASGTVHRKAPKITELTLEELAAQAVNAQQKRDKDKASLRWLGLMALGVIAAWLYLRSGNSS